jgi:hypothetical protein
MTSNISLAQPAIVWNEKTVLENAVQFIGQKKEQLDLYNDLWKAARHSGWYSNNSMQAAKKVSVIAETSKKEIEILNEVVTKLLNVKFKDSSSGQIKQLAKIATATQQGLNYFTLISNNSNYTFTNRVSRLGVNLACAFAGWATLLSGAAYMLDFTPHSYASLTWKISLLSGITSFALECLGESIDDKVKEMSSSLDKALLPSTN